MLRRCDEENVEAGCDIFEGGCNMCQPEDGSVTGTMVPATLYYCGHQINKFLELQ